MKASRKEYVERMQKMTLIHMNIAPLPKSIQREVEASHSKKCLRRIRTTIPDHKKDDVKEFLLHGLLDGKNYATIHAELECSDLFSNSKSDQYSLEFRYTTKLLHEISKTICRLGCYDHRIFLIHKYIRHGINKTQIAKKLGMRREAVYMAYRKSLKEKDNRS